MCLLWQNGQNVGRNYCNFYANRYNHCMITTIDDYIAQFSLPVQEILEKVRQTIAAVVPDAKETIAYWIPTFRLQRANLVHFAAFKTHIGFYPTPSGIHSFAKELSPYKTAKGSVQFPFHMPIPFELIARIVAYRLQEYTT